VVIASTGIGSVMVTETVPTDLTRINVDLDAKRRNSGVVMDIVSIKNGVVMALQIAKILEMK
jgi:hypothetical protein